MSSTGCERGWIVDKLISVILKAFIITIRTNWGMGKYKFEGGKTNSEKNATEELRGTADAFIAALGYKRVKYKEAHRATDGKIFITIIADEDEIGSPASLHVKDTAAFTQEFKRKHADAFSGLPTGVEIEIELRTYPSDGLVLRLDI